MMNVKIKGNLTYGIWLKAFQLTKKQACNPANIAKQAGWQPTNKAPELSHTAPKRLPTAPQTT